MSKSGNSFPVESKYLLLDIAIAFVFTALIIIIVFLYSLAWADSAEALSEQRLRMLTGYGTYYLLVIFTCLLTFRRMKREQVNFKALIGSVKVREIPWLMLLSVVYGAEGVSRGMSYLNAFIGNWIHPESIDAALETAAFLRSSEPLELVLAFVAAVIVAPLAEEFIFRGFLLTRWGLKWGIATSVVASSLLFGVIHGDFFISQRVLSGVVLSLLYCKTQMLLVPVIVHMLNNFIALMSQALTYSIESTRSANITPNYLWYALVNFVLATPALLYFLKIPSQTIEVPYIKNQANRSKR